MPATVIVGESKDDPFAEWDIQMPLFADDADDAGFKIKNRPGTENHRVHLTGYDRPGDMAVRGRLFHVIHGILGSDSGSVPATLIVFEWLFIPGRGGRRFREVEIDVTFAPHDRCPGTIPDDELSEYMPKVRTVAPSVPIKSYISDRTVTTEKNVTGALRVGYQPFAAVTSEVSRKRTETTERTDYRFVAGYPAFVNKMGGEPNSVHWTLQENAPQESGAPHLVRTAVLLQRTAYDDGSCSFSATIKTSARVSVLADAAEKFRKAVGSIPRDDPVYFDPRPVPGVAHGATVLYGMRDGLASRQSPCDNYNLGAVDLTQFLIIDDDKEWRTAPKSVLEGDNAQSPTNPSVQAGLNIPLNL